MLLAVLFFFFVVRFFARRAKNRTPALPQAARRLSARRVTPVNAEYARDTIVGTPATVIERLQRLVDAGVDYFIVSIPRIAYDQAPLQRFAQEVVPQFR
jgi:alkanesulfonate monooxygenase SsuD/methylene tetrahydromethanopterin reductase-like flavin-dependent oxidoreductase (luciferase family)